MNINNFYKWIVFVSLCFITSVEAKQGEPQPILVSFEERPTWQLQLAHDGPVIYHGAVSFDQAGGSKYGMLYPANNAGELFVGIFIHGMLESSKRKAQKQKILTDADIVLGNYQDILEKFTYQELITTAAGAIHFEAETEGEFASTESLVIDSAPSYLMTQDQKTLVLNNYLKLGQTDKDAKGVAVRIVSASIDAEEPYRYWHDRDGAPLKSASAELLSESIILALQYGDSAKEKNLPFKTVRYMQGGEEKIERAQVLFQDCDRFLLRNLRGMIMSVPISTKMLQASCEQSY